MDFIKDMVSGFIGGVCCTFAGLPLDLVKVRQQTIFKNKSLSSAEILNFLSDSKPLIRKKAARIIKNLK